MDDKKRQLRRTAAEEFMRSLEQLGELLSDEDESPLSTADPKSDSTLSAPNSVNTLAQDEEDDEDETLTKALGDFFQSSEPD